MNKITSLVLNPTVPYSPMVTKYTGFGGVGVVSEYNGWEAETASWKNTCYISANLSGLMPCYHVKGPDAEKLMNDYFVNNFSKMKVGKGRHGIMVSNKGNILEHGMVLRYAEDHFGTYAFQPYINYIVNSGKYDVDQVINTPGFKDFIYQIAGPRSLETIENAAKEDLHDLKFMEYCDAEIAGHKVRVIRMGMGGTIAYEVHGSLEASQDVYNAIVEAGTPFGIERLGWLSYQCNHTENGYPQIGQHFPYAFIDEPDFLEYTRNDPFSLFDPTLLPPMGSLSDDINDYFRNPIELGWGHMVKFDHDFHGKEALEKIAASNHKKTVTLVWNEEDILDVIGSYYRKNEEPYKKILMPFDQLANGFGNVQDRVLDSDGNIVGASMQPIYTIYYHDMISLCVIEPEFAKIGTEVTVIWGEKGSRQKKIRARVERYPYLDLTSNQDYDLETIPRYIG